MKTRLNMRKMKARLPKWLYTGLDWFVAGLIVALAALAIVGGIVFTLLVAVFLPSVVAAFVSWFCWTYLEIGAVYFDQLPKVWQHIPFLHFWAAWAAILWVIRLIARATRPAKRDHSFNEELRDGTGLTHGLQRKLHMRRKLRHEE